MASPTATSSNVSRYRPAILFFTGLAAAYSIYLLHDHFNASSTPGALHRSNAVHRPRRRRRRRTEAHELASRQASSSPPSEPALDRVTDPDLELETSDRDGPTLVWLRSDPHPDFGNFRFTTPAGEIVVELLVPETIRSADDFVRDYGFTQQHADEIAREVLHALLLRWLHRQFDVGESPPLPEVREVPAPIRARMTPRQVTVEAVNEAIRDYNGRMELRRLGGIWRSERGNESLDDEPSHVGDEDAGSELSWTPDRQSQGSEPRLMKLLFQITEDQARRDGFLHRGIDCNSCGAMPIRGVRYRCSNCLNFDLCETCEALQIHIPTHIFYKVRVPAPFLGISLLAQPVWYPGKPDLASQFIPRQLGEKFEEKTSFEKAVIEAMWEQFRCLAATEWPEDPNRLGLAIDKKTFIKCFCPSNEGRLPAPNLIYDRMFAFYDTNGDHLIGFEEFLMGIASVQNKSEKEKVKRLFQGYDIDGDGYVDRKDFLRIFRAHYAFTNELNKSVVAAMEEGLAEESNSREIIMGSQPISSAFGGSISAGHRRREGEGKWMNPAGDLELFEHVETVKDTGEDTVERREVIADAAERRAFPPRSNVLRQPWESIIISNSGRNGPEYRQPELAVELLQELLEAALRNAKAQKQNGTSSMNGEVEGNDIGGDKVEAEAGSAVAGEEAVTQDDGGAEKNLDVADSEESNANNSSDLAGDGTEETKPEPALEGWPPSWLKDVDLAVVGPVERSHLYTPREMREILVAARTRLLREESERREKVRQEAVDERWKRRQFYLDEEEGAIPAEVLEDSALKNVAMKDSHSHSPRSRSSSKVRFRDDVEDTDYDVRSNPSISSRSNILGERWGGYVLPEPERDAGREILYQCTQQGLNELLDPIFQEREDFAMEVLETTEERVQWRELLSKIEPASIESFAEILGKGLRPAGVTMTEKHFRRELDMLLDAAERSSGSRQHLERDSTVPEPPPFRDGMHDSHHHSVPSGSSWQPPWSQVNGHEKDNTHEKNNESVDGNAQQGPTPSRPSSPVDPTLPQHRPNFASSPVRQKPQHHSQPSVEFLIESDSPTPASPRISSPQAPPLPSDATSTTKSTPTPPSASRLRYLRMLDVAAVQISIRGGPGKIDFEEFVAAMAGDRKGSGDDNGSEEARGRRWAFLGNWLDLMSF